VQPFVRPFDAVHLTAGHNALRGSGKLELFRSVQIRPGTRRIRMSRNWQEFIVLGIFVLLLTAATLASVSDGSLSHMRGAWVAQAMR
jgi:hypothetical protein